MTVEDALSDHSVEVISCLAEATAEAALALGLIRVLTLLPLYDTSLDEVERHLAKAWESLLALRRLLEDAQVSHQQERFG